MKKLRNIGTVLSKAKQKEMHQYVRISQEVKNVRLMDTQEYVLVKQVVGSKNSK